HMLLKLQDSTYLVQQVVNRYRSRQYRDILPERTEYWGAHNLEEAIAGFDHHWYELTVDHHFLGCSIAELDIRRKTGATIMAMERDQRRYPYPQGKTIFEEGDRLLVVGSPGEQEKFKRFLHESK
ncbi:MAG: sodium:calcium exchanger, partial [Symploca sp. SIO2B6]|nr:sodium:calcium exchanger [Symploca sp. SIO2B6]